MIWLLSELKGELEDAIAHRQREIRLMEKLHQEAESTKYADSTRAYMLRNRGQYALEERLAILARLRKEKSRLPVPTI